MKKFILIFSLCCLYFNSGVIFAAEITLESPMLDFIDGKSFGMNAESFGLVLQNRREIRKRLFGIPAKSGRRVGMYTFEGRHYSLVELAKIESEIEAQYYAEKSKLEKSKTKYASVDYKAEFDTIEKQYKERKQELKEALIAAKEDFVSFTRGYMEAVGGIKEPLLVLIEEFCEKKGLNRCMLLKWGSVAAGAEEAFIMTNCNTFKEFSKFCEDLTSFLEIIARNCPKAKRQFVDLIKKAKKR